MATSSTATKSKAEELSHEQLQEAAWKTAAAPSRVELPAILALDPGGTTGWMYDGPVGGKRTMVIGDIKDPDHHLLLWNLLTKYRAHAHDVNFVIVCERFMFLKSEQGREKIEYSPAHYEGVVDLFAQTNQDIILVKQTSAQACGSTAFWGDSEKPGAGNSKLRTLGLYRGSKHTRDAIRHYLYYVSFDLGYKEYLNGLR